MLGVPTFVGCEVALVVVVDVVALLVLLVVGDAVAFFSAMAGGDVTCLLLLLDSVGALLDFSTRFSILKRKIFRYINPNYGT
jgi:hypothetical protein